MSSSSPRRDRGERGDDPGCAVAPLRAGLLDRPAGARAPSAPLGQAAVALSILAQHRERRRAARARPRRRRRANRPRASACTLPANPCAGAEVVHDRCRTSPAARGRRATRRQSQSADSRHASAQQSAPVHLEHDLRGEQRARRPPHQLARRIGDVRPHAREQPLVLPAAGASRWATSRIPDSPIEQGGTGPSVRRLGQVRGRPGSARAAPRRHRPPAGGRREPGAFEVVQGPDDAAGTQVDATVEGSGAALLVERVRRPQRLRSNAPSASATMAAMAARRRLAPAGARERLMRRAVVELGRHRASVSVTIPGRLRGKLAR